MSVSLAVNAVVTEQDRCLVHSRACDKVFPARTSCVLSDSTRSLVQVRDARAVERRGDIYIRCFMHVIDHI